MARTLAATAWLVIALTCVVAPAFGQASAQDWKVIDAKAYGCRFSMPGVPEERDGSSHGRKTHEYDLSVPPAVYGVLVSEYPAGSLAGKDPQKVIDQELAETAAPGTTLSEKVISLGGYPGREMVVDTPEYQAKVRFYVVKDRVYQILVLMMKEEVDDALRTKFLDSFALTN